MKTNMKISSAKFAGSSTQVTQKPARKLPEFAFIGRSNVGKSSLINMLCGNGKLAMTSGTPGKTRLVNHFLINDSWYLVDLPGYGFAKLPEKERAKLQDVIRDYLNHSQEMVMLFVLIDVRHDIGKIDMDFLNELGDSDIPSPSSSPKATSWVLWQGLRNWSGTRNSSENFGKSFRSAS